MSSALAVILIILFGLLSVTGIVTVIVENHPNKARKIRNDVNSEMVRRALKRKYK